MNDSLIKLGLRSQTLPGGIQLLLVAIFGTTLIAFLKSTYNRDSFTCEPETSSISKQLCYDEYSSAMNPWFTPLYFVVLAYIVLFVLSISFMLYGALTLRKLERDQQKKPDCFRRVYLLHLCCRLILILIMIGIFCGNQTLIVPKTYKCSEAAIATPSPLNGTETDLHCHDQHYREKSISNIGIIVIKVFIMILCTIEFIQVILTPADKLPEKLLRHVFENETTLVVEKPIAAKIPVQAPNYIERTQVESEIMEKLSTRRMIVLLGLPGMGKTQVAIRVSHLLAGKNQSVIFVKKQKNLLNICSEILYLLCGEDRMTGNDDILQQVTHKLSELQKDTVIIIDNTEHIQKKEDFDDFAQTLLASTPKVKLMITTRRNVNTVLPGIDTVHLRPMDTNSSAKLLKDVSVACKEYLEEICKLCGGMPLILLNCMYLVKDGFNPEVLVKELRNDPHQALKNNSDVYHKLGIFLREFPRDIKRNLVRLSVFPLTFSAEDMLILFETRAEVERVKTKMLKGSLLQNPEEGKYSIHPLVQAYCRKEGVSLGVSDEGDEAKKKFDDHYLERIKFLSKLFITKDKASEAISTFRKERANITEAFNNSFKDTTVETKKLFAIDVANGHEVLNFFTKVLSPPQECTQLYEKCYEISKDCDDKERRADSLNSLGFRQFLNWNEGQGTLDIFKKAYDIRTELSDEKRRCETHAHTIIKLGVCYVIQGEVEKGRGLVKEGINIRKKLGVSLYVAGGYCDLGHTYRYRDDYLQAVEIWENKTLPVYKRELGENPWTASLLQWIGYSYITLARGNSGDYADKAKKRLEEALKIQTKLLGDHLDTARSHVSLGDALRIQGKLKLALEELKKGLEIRENVLGPKHEKTMAAMKKIEELRRLVGEEYKPRDSFYVSSV